MQRIRNFFYKYLKALLRCFVKWVKYLTRVKNWSFDH